MQTSKNFPNTRRFNGVLLTVKKTKKRTKGREGIREDVRVPACYSQLLYETQQWVPINATTTSCWYSMRMCYLPL